ncbi:arsenosugar biosynthesis radical SAM protein ArsS [Granulosicoccaceae sp. 1_MG-2023]|nr:arsenosugar biosynthesis radical SAM protein ArsS [Granulosicoccaceae sp. 1_MG-2023]
MHDTLPLLAPGDFPPLKRSGIEILQVNLGYTCNLSCLHCHVNAGPHRKETMSAQTAADVIAFLDRSGATTLDLTGGAPEMHAQFRPLVEAGRERGCRVIDRCNLTVLQMPGQEDTAQFMADMGVDIVASLPCYLEDNVDAQRGDGTFRASIEVLRQLNDLGYGVPGSPLQLDLVYNPQGPELPPPQAGLEAQYRRFLEEEFGVSFSSLLALANQPIKRFGSTLVSRGQFADYMALLKSAHSDANLASVMCRNTLSIDYRGYVFDCDFNQMLGLTYGGTVPRYIGELDSVMRGHEVRVADHCYACTAGQGSGCGGALG